jgi:succinoglycan biosynthesis protein ExoM
MVNRIIVAGNHISICICTYRRNKMLERLLRNLAFLQSDGLFDYSIIVVDNDAAGSARQTVNNLRNILCLDIVYDIEKEQTIPAARNHALRLAKGNYIAIIDDDEFPSPQWLVMMFKAIKTFDVDGALGPVHPFFEQDPPSWLIKGKVCERPVFRTGTILRWDQTRTGNILLKREVFDEHGLRFNKKFKTSGSDRAFFKDAMQVGCRFVAVEEAPVYEIVPPYRWKAKYYVKRAIVHGYNAFNNVSMDLNYWSKFKMRLISIGAIVIYAILIPYGICCGRHKVFAYIEKGGYYLSRLCATIGIELIKKRDF